MGWKLNRYESTAWPGLYWSSGLVWPFLAWLSSFHFCSSFFSSSGGVVVYLLLFVCLLAWHTNYTYISIHDMIYTHRIENCSTQPYTTQHTTTQYVCMYVYTGMYITHQNG